MNQNEIFTTILNIYLHTQFNKKELLENFEI
jgi:hypothetical protein